MRSCEFHRGIRTAAVRGREKSAPADAVRKARRKAAERRRLREGADMAAALIGFVVMMLGCLLTVRSVTVGLAAFALGFWIFWL